MPVVVGAVAVKDMRTQPFVGTAFATLATKVMVVPPPPTTPAAHVLLLLVAVTLPLRMVHPAGIGGTVY